MISPKPYTVWSDFLSAATRVPESKKLRQLLFGKTPNIYRIIFAIDKRNHAVNVLHIRHGARAALPAESEKQ